MNLSLLYPQHNLSVYLESEREELERDTHLSLVLQILPDLAGSKVPHLDESVHTSCYEVLAVRRESGRLNVRLLTKL